MSTNDSGVDSTFSLKKNVEGTTDSKNYRLRINQEDRKGYRVRAKIGR